MATYSFSHLLSNLFAGLCKGSIRLRPYSDEFRRSLKYDVFGFEVMFALPSGGQANPDLVVTSKGVNHTLVIEWTRIGSVDGKEGQLERYSRVDKEALVNVLAVPLSAASSHDIVLVLRPPAVTSFKDFLDSKGWPFPILEFDDDGEGYLLARAEHEFTDTDTHGFFDRGVKVHAIPSRYIPFSLEEISHEALATFVVSYLISLIVRGIKEITTEEFCAGYVRLWGSIAPNKQRDIKTKTRQLLSEISRNPTGRQILKRREEDTLKWLLDHDSVFTLKRRSFQTYLTTFVARKEGREYQLELPFE